GRRGRGGGGPGAGAGGASSRPAPGGVVSRPSWSTVRWRALSAPGGTVVEARPGMPARDEAVRTLVALVCCAVARGERVWGHGG
ncbi:MAG: hypothetical protein ACT4PW_12955, partial [Acidimicrobiia bacterium]